MNLKLNLIAPEWPETIQLRADNSRERVQGLDSASISVKKLRMEEIDALCEDFRRFCTRNLPTDRSRIVLVTTSEAARPPKPVIEKD